MDEPKAPAPAPHTPTLPAQPHSIPHQQSQYYGQMNNNMGYYQAAPYNPYYQCEYPILMPEGGAACFGRIWLRHGGLRWPSLHIAQSI
jgi:hypothetical protein